MHSGRRWGTVCVRSLMSLFVVACCTIYAALPVVRTNHGMSETARIPVYDVDMAIGLCVWFLVLF